LVGDIALLDPGEIIPCDGVILSGHNVKCDESSATGESDEIKKVSYRQCIELRELAKMDRSSAEDDHAHTDCFLISGSRVLEGYGTYVVTAVGTKSFNGRILMGLLHSLLPFQIPMLTVTMHSFKRILREYPPADQIKPPCRIYCKTWLCGCTCAFHGTYDKIFRSTQDWSPGTVCIFHRV
jgi:magnesium-transporting ATPase (P-type)